MRPANSQDGHEFKWHVTVTVSVCILLVAWCWVEARCLASRRDSYRVLLAQIEQMSLDAEKIELLRTAPRLATERERPNDELTAEIRDAMAAVNIPVERWIGNDPLSPVRVPRSPYKRLSVRLLFEELSLRQLVEFSYHLIYTDRTLTIPYLRLFAPHARKDEMWNVDMSLTYLIYSPYDERRR